MVRHLGTYFIKLSRIWKTFEEGLSSGRITLTFLGKIIKIFHLHQGISICVRLCVYCRSEGVKINVLSDNDQIWHGLVRILPVLDTKFSTTNVDHPRTEFCSGSYGNQLSRNMAEKMTKIIKDS